MIKYIKIVNYMNGDTINKQIQDIIDNGMMDKDTRLFFDKGDCLTMWYSHQETTSLKDLSKMAKILTRKNGKKGLTNNSRCDNIESS